MVKKLFLIGMLLFAGGILCANIYFWTDKNGIRHYSNTSPPVDGTVQEIQEHQNILNRLSSTPDKGQHFDVLKVYDGDTVKVKGMGLVFTVRLVGIDAPETGYGGQKSQPFSHASRKYLSRLLENRQVRLKSYGTDQYNRQLAELFVDNTNINLAMIQAGLAEVYQGKRPKTLDSKGYLHQERQARQLFKGMWQQRKSYISPRQWRKEHPRK